MIHLIQPTMASSGKSMCIEKNQQHCLKGKTTKSKKQKAKKEGTTSPLLLSGFH